MDINLRKTLENLHSDLLMLRAEHGRAWALFHGNRFEDCEKAMLGCEEMRRNIIKKVEDALGIK